jgi:nucleoside-diphosphate-sugar epimerase
MERIVVTGAFGNVGRSVLAALAEMKSRKAMEVVAFEYPSRANKAYARGLASWPRVVWGSVTDRAALEAVVDGATGVIHLAAMIPPAADRDPEGARRVNEGGTAALIEALKARAPGARLVFSSSVAVYGDRVKDYRITAKDEPAPCDDDPYARQKVRCEQLIRESGLSWVICRLSYIVWRKKLKLDPLMFRMPLATHLEVCHTRDTGHALVNALWSDEACGRILNIAGGPSCRTTFGEYLRRMLELFGLGKKNFLSEAAFSPRGYHCAYLDSEVSESILHYQGTGIEDYYREVRRETRLMRPFITLVRPLARAWLTAKSPYLKKNFGQ